MAKQYKIAFKGEIADGFEAGRVRASFAKRLKKDEDVLEKLFSGKTVTLARNLEWKKATRTAERLRSLGAIVYLVDPDGNAFKAPAPANDDIEAVAEKDEGRHDVVVEHGRTDEPVAEDETEDEEDVQAQADAPIRTMRIPAAELEQLAKVQTARANADEPENPGP